MAKKVFLIIGLIVLTPFAIGVVGGTVSYFAGAL